MCIWTGSFKCIVDGFTTSVRIRKGWRAEQKDQGVASQVQLSKRTQTVRRPDKRAVRFLQKYSATWRKSKNNGIIAFVQGQEATKQVRQTLRRSRSGWSQDTQRVQAASRVGRNQGLVTSVIIWSEGFTFGNAEIRNGIVYFLAILAPFIHIPSLSTQGESGIEPGSFHLHYTPLGAAFASVTARFQELEWRSPTREKQRRMSHLYRVIWRARGKMHSLPTHAFCHPNIVTSLSFTAQVYWTEILIKHEFYLKAVMQQRWLKYLRNRSSWVRIPALYIAMWYLANYLESQDSVSLLIKIWILSSLQCFYKDGLTDT